MPSLAATFRVGILAVALVLVGHGSAQLADTPAGQALGLAIENNLELRAFPQRCTVFGEPATTIVGVLPINGQVLDAALAYHADLHGPSPRQAEELHDHAHDRYLTGSEAVFLLFVLNPNRIDADAVVLFGADDLVLEDEYREYATLRATPVFDANRPLGPGLTMGYVYFENFRTGPSESYALHVEGFYAELCDGATPAGMPFSFGFDESELDFFELLRRGVPADALRRDYRIPSYGERGLTSPDFLDIASLVLTVVGLVR